MATARVAWLQVLKAPVISLPTGVATGPTHATIGCTIDAVSGAGVLYGLARTGGLSQSADSIKAFGAQKANPTAGINTIDITGLTTSAHHIADFVYEDSVRGFSNVVTSGGSFVPAALTIAGTALSAQSVRAGGELAWAGVTPESLIGFPPGAGTPPTPWSIVSGAGASGATVDANTGILVIAAAGPVGTYNITLQRVDGSTAGASTPQAVTKAVTLVIAPSARIAWLQIDGNPALLPADPPSAVSGSATSGATSDIVWTPAGTGGTPTGFDVQYEAPTGSANWVTAAGAANPTGAGVASFSVTGQTPGMQVTPRVRALRTGFAASAWTVGAPYYLDTVIGGGGEIPNTSTTLPSAAATGAAGTVTATGGAGAALLSAAAAGGVAGTVTASGGAGAPLLSAAATGFAGAVTTAVGSNVLFDGTTPLAAAWVPNIGGVAATPVTGVDGIASMRFTCSFSLTGGNRVFWDVVPKDTIFTADDEDQIVVKIRTSNPAAFYNAVLYFSSSGGAFTSFYSGSAGLISVGTDWATVVMPKAGFSSTGTPNWSAINLVRLAVYPDKQADTEVYLASLVGRVGYPIAYIGQVGSYTDLTTARAGILAQVPAINRTAATSLLDQAAAQEAIGDQTAILAGNVLTGKAWALAQAGKDEFRGIWLPWGTGTTDASAPSTRLRRWSVGIPAIKAQGYNAIMPNMVGPGGAWYASSLVPHRSGVDSEGDYLAEILSYATPLGMTVHPWVECWRFSEFFKDTGASAAAARAGGLMALASDGVTEIYPPTLDWGNPVNQASMQAILVELATNYAIDSVHLDYNRAPDGYGGSYTTASRTAYETWSGSAVAVWPTDVLVGGSRYANWNDWQRYLFSTFIADVRTAVRAVKPAMQVSVAVLGNPEIARSGRLTDGFQSLFQDWADWTTQGYVDWVASFAYAETKYQTTTLIGIQQAVVTNPAVKLYPGLQMGITDSTGLLDAGVATDQVLAVRAAGLLGLAVYGWQDIYETAGNLGPYLRSGVFGDTVTTLVGVAGTGSAGVIEATGGAVAMLASAAAVGTAGTVTAFGALPMSSITLRGTESDALTVLRAFLLSILPPGIEVIKGQPNRVPEPLAEDFVVITSILLARLATTVTTVADGFPNFPQTRADVQATQFTVQVDVHGPAAQNNTQRITTLFRSDLAPSYFEGIASDIDTAPMFHSEPRQIPFINAEQQIETRWTFEVALECKPVITSAQQFADALAVTLFEIDTTYPPA